MKCLNTLTPIVTTRSRPARGAWIEMSNITLVPRLRPSRPARGAWIEISLGIYALICSCVAPRTGRVD